MVSMNVQIFEEEVCKIEIEFRYVTEALFLLYEARNQQPVASDEIVHSQTYEDVSNIEEIQHGQWKRIMLLVIAITVHNIPEGLAVGVGFGAIGRSTSATFESAR